MQTLSNSDGGSNHTWRRPGEQRGDAALGLNPGGGGGFLQVHIQTEIFCAPSMIF